MAHNETSFDNLTPEQRSEFGKRAAATRKANQEALQAAAAAGAAAAVLDRDPDPEPEPEPEPEPQPATRRVVTESVGHSPSRLEMLIARGPKRVHIEEDVTNHDQVKDPLLAGGSAKNSSEEYEPYILYINGRARVVPTGSLKVNLDVGFSIVCDLCGGDHPESETNPNACPVLRGKNGVQGIRCPICKKVIWGIPEGLPMAAPEDDPYVTSPEPTDPKAVAQVNWNKHMAAFHETAAATYGINAAALQAEISKMPMVPV